MSSSTSAAMPPATPAEWLERRLKRAIAVRVLATFNDRARGEAPVARRADGLFGPRSVAWRVHGDVASMMVGGFAALMLQMLHPAVLAGVWDHSRFRADMQGRLRRTARFIAVTTYGGRGEAEAAIARVRRIHAAIRGTLPDGTPYAAADPALLAWVHVTETTCFLAAYRRYVDPGMPVAERDRYVREMAVVGAALGADPAPESEAAAQALIRDMRPQLRADGRTRTIARLLIEHRVAEPVVAGVQALTAQAGLDLLPAWALRMHDRAPPAFGRQLARAGTAGLARTLRWALQP
jgi:uncharacterized protein (DUF2236 family)